MRTCGEEANSVSQSATQSRTDEGALAAWPRAQSSEDDDAQPVGTEAAPSWRRRATRAPAAAPVRRDLAVVNLP